MGWVFMIAALFGVLASAWLSNHALNARPSTEGRRDHYAASALVLHDAARQFAIVNTTHTGVIPSASLTLPTWYSNPGWTADVTADGIVRTYLATGVAAYGESRRFLAEASTRLYGSLTVGSVTANGYWNPAVGNVTAINVTSGLPTGTLFVSTKVR
jgi:hypothetical protein